MSLLAEYPSHWQMISSYPVVFIIFQTWVLFLPASGWAFYPTCVICSACPPPLAQEMFSSEVCLKPKKCPARGNANLGLLLPTAWKKPIPDRREEGYYTVGRWLRDYRRNRALMTVPEYCVSPVSLRYEDQLIPFLT